MPLFLSLIPSLNSKSHRASNYYNNHMSYYFPQTIVILSFLTITCGVLTSEMFQHVRNRGNSDAKWKEWKETYTKQFAILNITIVNHAKFNKAVDREFRFWQNMHKQQRHVFKVFYGSVSLLACSCLCVMSSIGIQWFYDETYTKHKSWARRFVSKPSKPINLSIIYQSINLNLN